MSILSWILDEGIVLIMEFFETVVLLLDLGASSLPWVDILRVIHYPNMVTLQTHTRMHTHAQKHLFQYCRASGLNNCELQPTFLVTSQTGNRKQTKVSSLPVSDRPMTRHLFNLDKRLSSGNRRQTYDLFLTQLCGPESPRIHNTTT